MTKHCSRCKTEFSCQNDQDGCWCEDLFLDMETLQKLKKEFDNCLCPECLRSYSTSESQK